MKESWILLFLILSVVGLESAVEILALGRKAEQVSLAFILELPSSFLNFLGLAG